METAKKIDLDAVLDYEWIYPNEIQKAKIDGNKLVGLCPFHDDSAPSLSVDLITGKFHCFACGAEGNYIQFVARKYGIDTKAAYKKILADNNLEAGNKPVSKVTGQSSYTVTEYALEKRLPVELLKDECHISSGNDRTGAYLKIPYLDEDGQELTFRKRYPKGSSKRFAWKYGGGGVPCMYGMWRMAKIREAEWVVLVEGESDAQTLWTMGIPALGVPGASTFKTEWVDELKGLTVLLHIEPDRGGETFYQVMMRKLSEGNFAGEIKTFSVGPLGVKDPNELWCRDGDEAKDKILNLINQAEIASLQQLVIANTVEGAPVALRQPDGWLFGEDGIWIVDEDGLKTNVCATPLMISRRLRNKDTGTERVEISFKRDGGWNQITMDRSDVFTSRGVVRLADFGATVNSENAKYIVRYLDALEKNNLDTIEMCVATEQTGWQSDGRFMPFFADDMIFDTQNSYILAYLCKNGTRDGWVESMRPHRERWRFRFILAASFAAPLLAIVKCRNFCLYNWGDSRGGKTAGLKAALSVWGDPDNLMCTYNGTENAIEAYCAVFNDLPVGIDERQISGSTEKGLSSLIYKLCEGTGRKRLNKDSALRQTRTWRNVFLTTGEEPIISDRTMTGVSSRIVEIIGGPFDREADAAEMHRVVAANCGWAGPEFIGALRSEDMRRTLRERYHALLKQLTDESLVNASHVACIAVVALADEVISKMFFGESDAEATRNALEMCRSVMDGIKRELPDDVNVNAARYLVSWIAMNKANFGDITRGPRYGMIEGDTVYLYPNAFQMAMDEGGYSARKVRKYLCKQGALKYSLVNGEKKYSVVKRVNGCLTRLVALIPSRLDATTEAGEWTDEIGQEELPW